MQRIIFLNAIASSKSLAMSNTFRCSRFDLDHILSRHCEPCFHKRPMIDRLEALFHPEVCQKLGGRYHTTMRDFETWFPGHQLDLRQPQRAYQHETLIRPREARGAAETEHPRIHDNRARLLQDLSAEGLLP